MDDLERTVTTPLELKSVGVDVAGRIIEGLAAAWPRDRGGDCIAETAFDASLRAREPGSLPAYWMHDTEQLPIGTVLEARPTPAGLWVKVLVHDTARGLELLAMARDLLSRNARLGMSIGYRAVKQRWDRLNGQLTRILDQIDLREVSFTVPGAQMQPLAAISGVKVLTSEEARAKLAELDEWSHQQWLQDRARARARDEQIADLERFLELHGGAPEPESERLARQRKLAALEERLDWAQRAAYERGWRP